MKKQLLLIAAIVFCTISGFSQAKFGHVNSQEILSVMPERATAERDIKAFQTTLETRMQSMNTEYQNKVAAFQSLDAATPESTLRDMENEIMGIQQRIQEFQQSAEGELMKKNEQLLQPMLKKVQDAIDAVGTENGFTYIFDVSTGTIVFENGEDVGPLVKTKLGL